MATTTPAGNKKNIEKDPRFAYTLANGLRILEAFSEGAAVLGNSDFSQYIGEHKSTVWRLTRTLCEMGYLKPKDGKFELGLATLSLAYPRLVNMPIRRIAHPLMQKLAEDIGGVVNLGLRDRQAIVIVESCRVVETIMNKPEIGARRPIADGFVGECFLAGASNEEREEVIKEIEARKPPGSKALRAAVQSRMVELKKNGFCFTSGNGANAIATTIRVSTSGETGFIACVVESKAMSKEKMIAAVPPRLSGMIASIERMLGTSATVEPV